MSKKKFMKIAPNEKYVKEVITDYDALSERCDEFDLVKNNKDVQEVVLTLKNTIRANDGMLGLSAPQVGFYNRILVLNFNNDLRTFINPIITQVDGFELTRETCHSIPGKTFIRTRNSRVWVTYQTPLGKIESVELNGVAARVMQHHIDHLDGLLLNDVSLEIDEEFDKATDAEREEVIKMYLDSLDLTASALQSSIEGDEEGKQIADAIKFMESVRKGETVIEKTPLTDKEFELLKAQWEKEKAESEETVEEENTDG
jgi:peptide deformylase